MLNPTLAAVSRMIKFSLTRAVSLLVVMLLSIFLTVLITGRSVLVEPDLLMPGQNPSPLHRWFTGVANPVVLPSHLAPTEWQSLNHFDTSLRLAVLGVRLQLGTAHNQYYASQRGVTQVSELILDALPRTLLVFGTANLLVFITSIWMALVLIRNYGGWLEKVFLALSPLSTIPAWIYGLLITVILARVFQIWLGGVLSVWPDEFSWGNVLLIFRHIWPPVLAIFLSKFFLSIYTWRSFLLVFAQEDYVELAKAKGLPKAAIDRRYLLRPALVNILTVFTVMMIAIWQEAIILELFFSVMGIGQLFYLAIRNLDTPVIVGLTAIFAYLLAISVFILDFTHAILDPRVRLGGGDHTSVQGGGKAVQKGRRLPVLRWASLSRRTDWDLPPVVIPASKSVHPLNRSFFRGLSSMWKDFRARRKQELIRLRELLFELRRYPAAIAGIAIISGLVIISVSAPAILPYQEAIRRWNYDNIERQRQPARAFPVWFNLFRKDPLPASMFINSREQPEIKSVSALGDDLGEILFTFPIDYHYRDFPQDIALYIQPRYIEKRPHITIEWTTPDGRRLDFGAFQASQSERYSFASNTRLMRQIQGKQPHIGLFANPEDPDKALPGQYELLLSAIVFEENADFEAELQLYGLVHGVAGTDHRRRDLGVALLWGAPVALAFGIMGALGTTLTSMVVAATSAWFEGWVDTLIQRLTEISMILPVFPILLIIYNFHWKSVWAILGVAVLLGVFGGAIKTYRSIFLSVKGAPYMEAARAYGTGSFRMIGHYLIPRILPVLIPQLIILVPTYVYLEATLAFLNMSDPVLPTWGKLIQEAVMHGGLDGAYHWLLLPAIILLLTGFAFIMVGYALERVLNPRLREQ
jgi:peptide/nickel transport system permease protein